MIQKPNVTDVNATLTRIAQSLDEKVDQSEYLSVIPTLASKNEVQELRGGVQTAILQRQDPSIKNSIQSIKDEVNRELSRFASLAALDDLKRLIRSTEDQVLCSPPSSFNIFVDCTCS